MEGIMCAYMKSICSLSLHFVPWNHYLFLFSFFCVCFSPSEVALIIRNNLKMALKAIFLCINKLETGYVSKV